jgi:two-component system chemotaxis sensor kinase CheA
MLKQSKNHAAASLRGRKQEKSILDSNDPARLLIIRNVLTVISSLMLLYTLFLLIMDDPAGRWLSVICMSLAAICVIGTACIKSKQSFSPITIIPLLLLALNGLGFFRLELVFPEGLSGIWILIIPFLAYFTAGKKYGFIFSLLTLLAGLCLVIFPFSVPQFYSSIKSIHIVIIYIMLFVMAHRCELVRISDEKKLETLSMQLKSEHDFLVVIRENIKSGLFVMDKNLVIQDNYSALFEKIIGSSNLTGKKITDLFTSSLKSAEIEMIEDFFDMMITRRFDADMIDDINPLQELKFTDPAGVNKILHCVFTTIDNISSETMVLGNIEDITAKVELREKMHQEEVRCREEMTYLFEVLQVDQSVLTDFIEDTEYEFGVINDILKNSKLSSEESLLVVFQSLHAIKSNAVIIGLNNYGEKLHEIENYVKYLQDLPEITFDDMLSLTVKIEEIMRDKDRFTENIEKIKSYNASSTKKNTLDILIENLQRAAKRIAGNTGKQVILDTSGMDIAALETAPRRVVKETLLQLVRNAVFHGLETPEERVKNGKLETGNIFISAKLEDDTIHIILQDDGKGLDFEKIKERAVSMHIIDENEIIEDKNRVYQAIFMPGFSTVKNANINAGRGVGLNLVRARVNEHNGSVKIATEYGKGTAFHIFLPVENAKLGDPKNYG